MSDKSDKVDDIYELIKGGMDVLDEHEDKLDNLFGSNDSIEIGDNEPLKDLTKSEDEVKVTVETDSDLDSISIRKEEDSVIISMGEKEVIAKTPEDVNLSGVDANLNNGVLDVTIPRGDD